MQTNIYNQRRKEEYFTYLDAVSSGQMLSPHTDLRRLAAQQYQIVQLFFQLLSVMSTSQTRIARIASILCKMLAKI